MLLKTVTCNKHVTIYSNKDLLLKVLLFLTDMQISKINKLYITLKSIQWLTKVHDKCKFEQIFFIWTSQCDSMPCKMPPHCFHGQISPPFENPHKMVQYFLRWDH